MESDSRFGPKSTANDVLSGLDLKGRTILVTGANSGIGLETVRALAGHGARIIALARRLQSAEAVRDRIGPESIAVECDLASLHSVRRAICTILDLDMPLDAVITNAGIAAPTALRLLDGDESQFFVNHLAHFFLVTRVLDLVPDATGRIVIGSSSSSIGQAPKQGIMFDNLDGNRFYKPFVFYGQSKFATALFAKELARRVSGRGICVNSVHPGATGGTNLNNDLPAPLKAIQKVAQLFMKTPAQGAATQCLLAASPLANRVSGEYWADCRVAKGNTLLNDREISQKLWKVSEDLIARILTAGDLRPSLYAA
jgi:WW domain-containing oxidoreductase